MLGGFVTVSLRVMTAGAGYRYLLQSVAAGDGHWYAEHPLVRYYHESGAPPGQWLGAGLPGLGHHESSNDGAIKAGDVVTEGHLRRLLGQARDPVTGIPLGSPYRNYRPTPGSGKQDSGRQAVAGFDLTFSVPKSLSALWGCSDAGVQALLTDAHHGAIRDVLDMVEREVACTRVGAAGPDGAVAQVEVRGLVAMAYDHYDSRAGDPQLHTHVVIANRVQRLDGKWRTLDGRPLHAAVVALSEHYNAVLADRVHALIGARWEARERGRDRNPAWEVTAVPEDLIAEFSTRSAAINAEVIRLIDAYVAEHGRQPPKVVIIKLRQQATLSTRPDKHLRPLADLTQDWRLRAAPILGEDPVGWASRIAGGAPGRGIQAGDIPLDDIDALGRAVVAKVADRRSTWRRFNLMAEAARLTMPARFATAAEREAVTHMIADAAEVASIRLTPTGEASVPAAFTRTGGDSAFLPNSAIYYSCQQIMAAEQRLLDLARQRGAPACDLTAATVMTADAGIAADQRAVIELIASSGKTLDLLVGPAGAGKTRTLAALKTLWEQAHGEGTVVGLAPSAAAAQVLADDLHIGCENTAKWLWDHHHAHQSLQAGQLLLVDEASLAGTLTLAKLASHAADVGAKIVLIGDWAQLTAVDAGGGFGMLARDLNHVPELSAVRRFEHEWEKNATLKVRLGDAAALDSYQAHGRLHGADSGQVVDAAYQAWRADRDRGLSSILIAPTSEAMTELNTRARTDLIAAGHVLADGVALHDGTEASQGDLIVTRRNDRRLRAGTSWVKNGDRWQVVHALADGALTVRRADGRGRGTCTLPAAYVAHDVELGYAITAHRAQGATVDTSHVICPPAGMTREVLYVAMTRGRSANHAWVALDHPNLEPHQVYAPGQEPTPRSILARVLATSGAELAAIERQAEQKDTYASIAQLAAEYETIAQAAHTDRWATVLDAAGLDPEVARQIAESEAFGPLVAELRRAEAAGLPATSLLLAATRALATNLEEPRDWAAVLHHRLRGATANAQPDARPGDYLAGLIPEASGPMRDDMKQALSERAALIEQRATSLVRQAISEPAGWLIALGPPPSGQADRAAWADCARTIAAYRDRYTITAPDPCGPPAPSVSQRIDQQRAEAAFRHARSLADPRDPFAPSARPPAPAL